MKISVVIPCYNAEDWLGQAIGSLLEQTRPPDEIIVVDDGSTDGSRKVAERFGDHVGPHVKVVTRRSGSAPETRNHGASLATGDAIMFLDADDVLGPETLEALADEIRRHPGSVAACPWYRLERIAGSWVERPPTCAPLRAGQDYLDGWLRGWYHPTSSVLWSRTAFDRAGGWDPRAKGPNDDGDLMMRALVRGVPLHVTSRGAAYYRRLPDGADSVSGARLTREGLRSRIGVVWRTARALARQGRLDRYRASVDESLATISAGCGAGQRDLARRCALLRERYGRPRWRRRVVAWRRRLLSLGRRIGRRVRALVRWREAKGASVEPQRREIRYGLEAARRMTHDTERDEGAPPENSRSAGSPAVSVIIPTYQRAHLLPRTLDSVLRQTFQDLEVLVVDDGSTDRTPEIVEDYDDARVRYLPQPRNAGVSAARNRGLQGARGRMIAFLDSDDEWMPEKLERQVRRLEAAGPDVGLVYCGVEDVDDRGVVQVHRPVFRGRLQRELLLENVLHGGGSSVLLRGEAVQAVGLFDDTLPAIEDWDYWLRVARLYRIDFVEEPLVRYHDVTVDGRKSLDAARNLAARELFRKKHGPAMREEGVEPLFVLESSRRALYWYVDRSRARRLALRAVRLSPRNPEGYRAFVRALPRPLHEGLAFIFRIVRWTTRPLQGLVGR